MWFWYCENDREEICLLRVFGDMPVVRVPERIMGKPVTELADYCFSEKSVLNEREDHLKISALEEEKEISVLTFEEEREKGRFCELSGEFITEVWLPSSVRKLGNLCFYQCSKLRTLSLGKDTMEIGSDCFMNCRELTTFFLQTEAGNETGLRQILAQRTQATDVFFKNAAVHFPEFSEHYDLIGPAHIFELNIEGEGFRARQCFERGIFQFEKYDKIFAQARDAESEKTLCKMAAYRLKFPLDLGDSAKKQYTQYVLCHMEALCEEVIAEKDLTLLERLAQQGFMGESHWELCIRKMMQTQWVQGIRMLLEWKKRWQKEKEGSWYEFEDF